MGFATTLLFLFCTPDLDTLFALDAPQPFVQIYALALGKGGSIFMTIIATLGLILVGILACYIAGMFADLTYHRAPVLLLSLRRV